MNITYLASKAVKTFLQTKTFAGIPSTSIYTGIHNTTDDSVLVNRDEISVPCIIVECSVAQAKEHNTGNWNAFVNVIVISNGDDETAENHHAMVTAVYSEIMTTTIKADLSAAISGFTAKIVRFREQRTKIKNGNWESHLGFEVDCCASVIS